ncbi:hypothetical protein C4D60_Mb01t11860 [Musa balbisiana]|uniref:Uncharacterized protein n=1 Tax=Musa balbisiana TaxID=52838 RepID=A0A4S8JMW9_MUSBA|nr:hypothetical protein C4D60_Mb01t11860 [Musa balbisiana]
MVIGRKSTVQLPYLRVSGESSDRFPRPRNSGEPTPHPWATLVSVETSPCSVPSLRREIFLSRGTQNDFKPQALKCAVDGSHRRIFVNWKPSPHFISQEMAPSLRFGRLGSRIRCSSRAITHSSSTAQGLHRFLYNPIEIYVSFPPIWIVLKHPTSGGGAWP